MKGSKREAGAMEDEETEMIEGGSMEEEKTKGRCCRAYCIKNASVSSQGAGY